MKNQYAWPFIVIRRTTGKCIHIQYRQGFDNYNSLLPKISDLAVRLFKVSVQNQILLIKGEPIDESSFNKFLCQINRSKRSQNNLMHVLDKFKLNQDKINVTIHDNVNSKKWTLKFSSNSFVSQIAQTIFGSQNSQVYYLFYAGKILNKQMTIRQQMIENYSQILIFHSTVFEGNFLLFSHQNLAKQSLQQRNQNSNIQKSYLTFGNSQNSLKNSCNGVISEKGPYDSQNFSVKNKLLSSSKSSVTAYFLSTQKSNRNYSVQKQQQLAQQDQAQAESQISNSIVDIQNIDDYQIDQEYADLFPFNQSRLLNHKSKVSQALKTSIKNSKKNQNLSLTDRIAPNNISSLNILTITQKDTKQTLRSQNNFLSQQVQKKVNEDSKTNSNYDHVVEPKSQQRLPIFGLSPTLKKSNMGIQNSRKTGLQQCQSEIISFVSQQTYQSIQESQIIQDQMKVLNQQIHYDYVPFIIEQKLQIPTVIRSILRRKINIQKKYGHDSQEIREQDQCIQQKQQVHNLQQNRYSNRTNDNQAKIKSSTTAQYSISSSNNETKSRKNLLNKIVNQILKKNAHYRLSLRYQQQMAQLDQMTQTRRNFNQRKFLRFSQQTAFQQHEEQKHHKNDVIKQFKKSTVGRNLSLGQDIQMIEDFLRQSFEKMNGQNQQNLSADQYKEQIYASLKDELSNDKDAIYSQDNCLASQSDELRKSCQLRLTARYLQNRNNEAIQEQGKQSSNDGSAI